MDLLHVLLRLIHIGAGILWVGGAVVFFSFVEPTAAELGADAEKFMERVIVRRKLPIYFLVLSLLTVLGGLVLYWIDSDGLQASWIGTPFGLALTIGGIAGLIAFVGGNLLIKSNVEKLAEVGAAMRAAGGPPSDALLRQMHDVQARLHSVGVWDTVILAVAVIAMASARYL